jgi:hypothetical protein
MAHPVVGFTMKFASNEERCQAGRPPNPPCRPHTGDITPMSRIGISDMSLLPEALARLMQELMQIRDRVTPAATFDPTPPERWEDEEFIYLEVDLNGDLGLDIDICIHHSGRAFIRMDQSPSGPIYPT